MFDLSIDMKLDILIVLFSIWVLAFILGLTYRIRKFLSGNDLERMSETMNKLDHKGDFSGLVEYCDSFLEQMPENTNLIWSKARALFKLGNYQEALQLFEKIKTTEPIWAEDAEKYIKSISEKNT